MQIISGVGLVLNGVLTLLGNILNGIGLGGILNGILDALGLNKLLGRFVVPILYLLSSTLFSFVMLLTDLVHLPLI